MFHHDLPDLFAITAIFFAAGMVKGILGMGLPTIAMGLLGLVMPVAGAASLLTVPSFVTNVWQAVAGSRFALTLKRLWGMQAGIVVGTVAVPWLWPAAGDLIGRKLLGVCLLVYGLVGLVGRSPRPVPAAWERWLAPMVGLATGIVTGLTGVFVLPAVPYLQALKLAKDELAQALGLCFTTSTVALAVVLAVQGHLNAGSSMGSVAMVVPAVVGMWMGQRVRGGMSEATFRKAFFAGLVLLGAWLGSA